MWGVGRVGVFMGNIGGVGGSFWRLSWSHRRSARQACGEFCCTAFLVSWGGLRVVRGRWGEGGLFHVSRRAVVSLEMKKTNL